MLNFLQTNRLHDQMFTQNQASRVHMGSSTHVHIGSNIPGVHRISSIHVHAGLSLHCSRNYSKLLTLFLCCKKWHVPYVFCTPFPLIVYNSTQKTHIRFNDLPVLHDLLYQIPTTLSFLNDLDLCPSLKVKVPLVLLRIVSDGPVLLPKSGLWYLTSCVKGCLLSPPKIHNTNERNLNICLELSSSTYGIEWQPRTMRKKCKKCNYSRNERKYFHHRLEILCQNLKIKDYCNHISYSFQSYKLKVHMVKVNFNSITLYKHIYNNHINVSNI